MFITLIATCVAKKAKEPPGLWDGTYNTNFEAKYFGEKWKYDWEKIFEQYYSVEKSTINFIDKIEIIYNFEKFSWKPLPFEFLGVHGVEPS